MCAANPAALMQFHIEAFADSERESSQNAIVESITGSMRQDRCKKYNSWSSTLFEAYAFAVCRLRKQIAQIIVSSHFSDDDID